MADPLFYEGTGAPNVKAYRLGKTLITIGTGARLACAAAGFQYTRSLQYIYPLNLDETVLVAGMPQGELTLSVLVGPSSGIASFISSYSSICNLASQNIRLNPTDACSSGTGVAFTFSGLAIAGISGQVSRTEAGNIVIPQITMQFVAMDIK